MWNNYLNGLNETDISQKFIQLWDGDISSIQLINLGINAVFKFSKKGQNYYLRITHEKLRPLKSVTQAIDFQNHLFNEGAPVCKPVLSNNNEYIESLEIKKNLYLGHVCAEISGHVINLDMENLDIYYNWGQSLGKLHKASQNYIPPEAFNFNNWQDLMIKIVNYAEKDTPLLPYYDRLYEWVSSLPQVQNQYGMIHGDHRNANVIFKDTHVGIIDFDSPNYHWYMFDIMRPFLEIYLTPQEIWAPKFKKYIEGYRSVHPIDPDLLKQGGNFIQLKSLDLYLWTKNNWSADEIPGGGNKAEWLEMLLNTIKSSSTLDSSIIK